MSVTSIKCIVAEDADRSGKSIASLMHQLPGYEVEEIFHSKKKLINYLNKQSPEIAIIDLDMAELKGYNFLKQVTTNPRIIVVSSNNNLAVDGYNHSIAGYLPKPFTCDMLTTVLKNVLSNNIDKTIEHITKIQQHRFIFIRAEYKLIKINFDDILYIEGLKDYSKIYTTPAAGKAIITLQNLKSFEEKLSPNDFIRVHRSYIVSLSKIDVIHKNSILIGKHEIPVSDGFRAHLHSNISKYM